MNDSGTGGPAVFKEVRSLGVEVEPNVWGCRRRTLPRLTMPRSTRAPAQTSERSNTVAPAPPWPL